MDSVLQYQQRLDRELSKYRAFNDVEKKTGVPKVYSTLGVCGFLFILIFFDLGAQLIVNLVGFIYPAYQSFKALETFRKTDDTQWLTYWVVFGFFNIVEYFEASLLFYIPFYYMFKLGFVLWLFLPFTRGADKIYGSVLKPMLMETTRSSSRKDKGSSSSDEDK